jgi:hypothetical protein
MVNPVGSAQQTINMVPGQTANSYVMAGALQESQLAELQSSLMSQAQAASQIPWYKNLLGAVVTVAGTITAGLYFLGRNANHQMIESAFKSEKAQKMIQHLDKVSIGPLSEALILIKDPAQPKLIGVINEHKLETQDPQRKATEEDKAKHRERLERFRSAVDEADHAFHIKVQDGKYIGLRGLKLVGNISTGWKRLFSPPKSQLQTA